MGNFRRICARASLSLAASGAIWAAPALAESASTASPIPLQPVWAWASSQQDTAAQPQPRTNPEAEGTRVPAEQVELPERDAPYPPEPSAPAPPSNPVDLELVVSQFLDAPIIGDADSTARYSGRVDGYFEFGGELVGASSDLSLKLRPEFTWGEDSNGAVGLIPVNSALFRREGVSDFDLAASLVYEWREGARLEVGKINLLDVSAEIPILESNGHIGFQNLGIALPPTGIAPNTITGATLYIDTEEAIYRVWVFDPDSQYGRTGFETAFESGVAFLGAAAFRTRVRGLPGIVNFAVAASTRDGINSDILPSALAPPPPPLGTFGNTQGELALQLSAYQYLDLYPEAPGKGWGILARFQAARGDPTFLDRSGYFGIAGNPRFRPQDRFGIAYFHYSLTDELVDDIAFRLDIEDEQGVEAFYTYQLADTIGLSANVQVVDSAVASRATGVTVGMRLTTVF